MKYDTEAVKNEITADIRKEMLESLQASKEVPNFMKASGNRFIEVWVAGCWLNNKLKESGADEAIISRIGQAHGQRSFFESPYKWAAIYYNEYVDNGSVKDKPGIELADDINSQHIKIEGGIIAITQEDEK